MFPLIIYFCNVLQYVLTIKGFPEAKELKQIVRDFVAPNKPLGHSDRNSSNNSTAAIVGVVVEEFVDEVEDN